MKHKTPIDTRNERHIDQRQELTAHADRLSERQAAAWALSMLRGELSAHSALFWANALNFHMKRMKAHAVHDMRH